MSQPYANYPAASRAESDPAFSSAIQKQRKPVHRIHLGNAYTHRSALLPAVECMAFFLTALLLSCAQTFWSGSPQLTLLFDSSGYLWIADGLLQIFKSDSIVTAVVHYFAAGCPETARLSLATMLAPVADVCKTGPVLPLIVALGHGIAGKSATYANWNVSAFIMCATSSLVAPILWLWGRKLSGNGLARISALLAATYSGFLVNSGRLLSEVPAVTLCTLALFLIYLAVHRVWNEFSPEPHNRGIEGSGVAPGDPWQRAMPRVTSISMLLLFLSNGIIIGLSSAIIMMARPPLLLLPLVLALVIPVLIIRFRPLAHDGVDPSSASRESQSQSTSSDTRSFSSTKALSRADQVSDSFAPQLPRSLSSSGSFADTGRAVCQVEQNRLLTGEPENGTHRSSPKNKLFSYMVVLVAGTVFGATLILTPWATCKQILTGKASITVDRYGAYNLSTGCNLSNDGWDVLPSAFVNHPEQFKQTIPQVVHEVISEATRAPGDFLNLMLRKPGRLAAAPWNDFQVPCLGVPWLAQRFWHQFLLIAALFGFLCLAKESVNKHDRKLALFATIGGALIVYHLVNALFITMNRYFVAGMPVILLLAGWALHSCLIGKVRNAPACLTALLIFPAASAGAVLVLDPITICSLRNVVDPSIFNLLYSVGITSTLAASLILGSRNFAPAKFLKLPVAIVFAAITMCCLTSSSEDAGSVAGVVRGADVAGKNIRLETGSLSDVKWMPEEYVQRLHLSDEASLAVPSAPFRWFLVVDHPGGVISSKSFSVLLNERRVNGTWAPLWSLMPQSRENLTYLAAFAYSAKKPVEDINQWSCLPIPADFLKPQNNVFALSDSQQIKVMADCVNTEQNESLSLTAFSWSKGFFSDHPGEMRTREVGVETSATSAVQASKSSETDGGNANVRPRTFLVAVPDSPSRKNMSPLRFSFPDSEIGLSSANGVKCLELNDKRLREIPSDFLRIQVSGQVRNRSRSDRSGAASIGLIETLNRNGAQFKEFAPLAPQSIAATNTWRSFMFADYLSLNSNSQQSKIDSLRILLASRPWWEVLSYNSFKGKCLLEFKDLTLEITEVAPLTSTAMAIPLRVSPGENPLSEARSVFEQDASEKISQIPQAD